MERTGRSLQASPTGLIQANKAVLQFARKADLAAELAISRSTIQKFFAGKPIARENFHQICDRLGLDWRVISEEQDSDPEHSIEPELPDVESLVQLVRQQGQGSVQAQYGMIRVLDMAQPLALLDIYANTNVLEKISGRRRMDVTQLSTQSQVEVERFLSLLNTERVAALDLVAQVKKLIILGRPGVGKTTFLKFLAVQCSLGNFQPDCVPILISLKNFAENPEQPSLLNYISLQIEDYGVTLTQVAEPLLQQGRLLLLLDGLDEVKERDRDRVVQEIQRLALRFPDNRVIMTCRLASHNYVFEQFTEVEVAAFNEEQIRQFVRSWFSARISNSRVASAIASCCLENLFLSVNLPIRELASNSLLLTLLCLVFEDRGAFARDRTGLYQEGLDILLKQWDVKRNIQRKSIDPNFTLPHRFALLSRLAWVTFEQSNYFFTHSEVEQHIREYLDAQLPLCVDSATILQSIEAQHGLIVQRARDVYSFSHLTFHEYFAAREIVTAHDAERLNRLVSHMGKPRWREVFLLVIEMLPHPDQLLQSMRAHLEHLAATDGELQQFLSWLQAKSTDVNTFFSSVVTRAFYFDLEVTRSSPRSQRLLDLARALQPDLTRSLSADLSLDLALDRVLALAQYVGAVEKPRLTFKRVINRAIERAKPLQSLSLIEALEHLSAVIPNDSAFEGWWQTNGSGWREGLRHTLQKERNIGCNWQSESLRQYYDACCLFVDCLNSTLRDRRDTSDLMQASLEGLF